MSQLLPLLGGIVSAAVGGGGGVYAFLTVGSTKRKVNAEAIHIKATADETLADTVKVLIGSAADLVEPLKRELGEARLDLGRLRGDVTVMEVRVRRIVGMIHQPNMTLPRLRQLVPLEVEDTFNGHNS